MRYLPYKFFFCRYSRLQELVCFVLIASDGVKRAAIARATGMMANFIVVRSGMSREKERNVCKSWNY